MSARFSIPDFLNLRMLDREVFDLSVVPARRDDQR